ncbi:hypothetical protein BCR33DRAFT_58309 [Rhizoclosmatium globosum]|uniref:Sfi1 spindle body domain-containing protein n=1 Tax=Rhizoclosmatium globosum TaxID=329046 RepID=A0A1Y2CM52_9FUNG|nr:hypothetical protein BCR33DRAFT_58309 [Rhizoclosmatium globosum]|eukprot:ORY48090.1 hypothetical protein BCR33DRAFT_58309 [Rhizoclosmatium globosum]
MKLEASDFSTHHQLCRNFAKWKAATQKTRTDRNNQQLAELHHMRQLKKQILTRLNTVNGWIKLADSKRRKNLLGVFLSKWRYRTTGSLSRKEGAYLEPGKVHHETKLKQQVFYAWINFVTIEKAEREKEKQATTFHANRLLQFTFEVFHKKYRLRRLQIEMQILATRHHAFTVTYKSFERG